MAVKLGIAQFVALTAVVAVTQSLPGADPSEAAISFACAGVALAWAAVQLVIPARRSLLWLFPFGSGLYIALASGAVAARAVHPRRCECC